MRVLIIRLSSIGDVILTTPVLKELKKKYPDIIIDFLVLENFKDAISGCPYIDNLILFNKKKHDGLKKMIAFGNELKKNNYDYVFDLHSKVRSKVISNAIGSKVYTYKKRSFIKSILVKTKMIKYKVDDTIIKNYFGAFKVLGLEYKGEDLTFSFDRKDSEKLEAMGIDYSNVPMIAPGASKETKKWTKEGFAELSKLLYNKYGKSPIIIGSKSEYEMCEEIKRLSGDIAINMAGKLTLKESGALLSRAKFLVTNDSGPFHIARGVKCPTFVIFGPTSPEMFEYDEKNILIYLNEPCSPCSLHGDKVCPQKHFNCMKKLSAQKVMEIIEKSGR
ncbi:glycosyltransferase family 9 protein [Candidatus Cetobacterium colombiensis]|uniref:Glycosyltransferase family 9 protein n=1 Tax=Candidatus Cetobacterium colombiensis TaxID=3073100 RepID=A0ABU4W9Z9_9FUSO|nr:glycosyltransferase family 9 protein [Candidatus Cetobacterium colombiensis]MDX8336359.1 glycosyltransferase family 9 protein [Candidatus Cetobacterium colombiensis]